MQHRPCQMLGAGLSKSPEDGPPSQPSALDTKTQVQRKRWEVMPLGNDGHGSGSHGGKALR